MIKIFIRDPDESSDRAGVIKQKITLNSLND